MCSEYPIAVENISGRKTKIPEAKVIRILVIRLDWFDFLFKMEGNFCRKNAKSVKLKKRAATKEIHPKSLACNSIIDF